MDNTLHTPQTNESTSDSTQDKKEEKKTEKKEEPISENKNEQKESKELHIEDFAADSEGSDSVSLPKVKNIKKSLSSLFQQKTAIKKYGFVFLLLFVLIINVHFKIQPAYLPYGDIWAEDQVNSQIRTQVLAQLRVEYPNLPPQQLQQLLQKEVKKATKGIGERYEQSIEEMANNFRGNYQDENGQTYLIAIDPYQYYRYTKNIVENGFIGDELRDGEPYDTHMVAPLGKKTGPSLHPYLSAYTYKFIHFFKKDITVLTVVFFMPLIIITLALIPAFFIGRKIAGNLGGFFGALYIALNTTLQSKTVAGASDTESYIIFFFLFILWMFLEACEAKTLKRKIIFSGITGLSLGIFNFAWTGWWICGYLILGTLLLYLAFILFKERKSILPMLKEHGWFHQFPKKIKTLLWHQKDIQGVWLLGVGITLFSIIGLFLVRGKLVYRYVQLFFILPFHYGTSIEASIKTGALWPNVYTTVRELHNIPFSKIFQYLGGSIFLILAIIGVILLIMNYKKKLNIISGFLFALWLGGMLYITKMMGQRFVLSLVPVIGLGVGIFIGVFTSLAIRYLKKFIPQDHKHYTRSRIITIIIIIFITGLILGFSPFPPFCEYGMCGQTKSYVSQIGPQFDDGWYYTLTKIKKESQPNAIINSWWDFGHLFKAYADRAVTFDGASQNVPQAHWIAKALVTSNEKESAAILRMLNCGANTAFNLIFKKEQDFLPAINLLNNLLLQTKQQAKETLKKAGYTEEEITEINKNLYCTPPESFLITSGDMVEKSGVWSHFGAWDFDRAWMWDQVRSLPPSKGVLKIQEKLGYTEEKAKETYESLISFHLAIETNEWISPLLNYGNRALCEEKQGKIHCEITIQNFPLIFEIDSVSKETQIVNSKEGHSPYSLIWIDEKGFHEKIFEGASPTIEYSLSLFHYEDQYEILVVEKGLGTSMFHRLFYHEGVGLNHFKLFSKQESSTTGTISTWKVNWDNLDT